MTTKEQETKALRQIEKILASLGENSYVATAFEGCLQIAEENIQNDFACSMKQRAEAAEEKAKTLEMVLREAQSATETYERAYKREQENHAYAIQEMQNKLTEQKKKMLDRDHYKEIWNLCYEQIQSNEAWMKLAADNMADFSDNPTDIGFVDAVKNYKKYKAAYEAQTKLLDYLDTLNFDEDK